MRPKDANKAFSLAVMLLFVLEILAPFSYAADPAPKIDSNINYPSGFIGGAQSCTVDSITPQEVQTLYANTVGKPIEQLSDMPTDAALLSRSNPVDDFLNEEPDKAQGASNSDPYFQRSIPAAQVAPILVPSAFGSNADLLAALGVSWDQEKEKPEDVLAEIFISPAELRQLGDNKGGQASERVEGVLSQIGFGKDKDKVKGPEREALPYENKKIMLPGGKVLSFEQLKASTDLNPQSCLLNGVVQGRVGYLGVLDSDLAYGNINNQLLSGEFISAPTGNPDTELSDPRGINQKITGDSLRGFLNLNGGANMLIPSFYEYWLVTAQKINAYQFASSLFAGIGTQGAINGITAVRTLKKERLESLISEEAALSRSLGAPGLSPATSTTLNTRYNEIVDQAEEIRRSVEFYDKYEGFWKRAQKSFSPLLGSSLMIGFGWLGPARLLFQANEGLLFSTTRNPEEYVKLMVNRRVANRFEQASDPWGLGTLQEILAKHTDVSLGPDKMFNPGKIILANYPLGGGQVRDSVTSISSETGWTIATQWKGSSYAYNAEDHTSISKTEKFTSIALLGNEVLPDVVINKNIQGDVYTFVSSLGLPFLVARGLPAEIGRTFALSGALYTFGLAVKADPDYGKDAVCDPEEFQDLVGKYKVWTIALGVGELILPFTPLLATTKLVGRAANFLDSASRQVIEINSYINPLQIYQIYWGNKIMTYVSNCKDPQYKVLAYQPLEKPTVEEPSQAQSALSGAQDALSALNIFQSTESTSEINLDEYSDVLNFQVNVQDQQGSLFPSSLKRVQVDQSSWMLPGGLFDQLNGTGCFLQENNPTSDGGVISISRDGLKKINKDGSVAFDFNSFYWKLRAASILRSQELARMIIPNQVITTVLDGGNVPFIAINAAGKSTIVNRNCEAATCLSTKIKELKPDFDGADLTSAIGTISSVETDQGIASFTGNSIAFTKTSIGQVGVETRAPSLAFVANQTGLGRTTSGGSMQIIGNGSVVLNGPAGDFNGMDVGTLKTIMGDKGKIEYDPYANRLYVFIYVLAEGNAQEINDILGSAKTIPNPNGGAPINVVNLDLKGKDAFKENVDKLNEILRDIQSPDGGKTQGGFQVLETPDSIVYFTPDGKVKVIDKKTGEVKTFDLTGQPYRDANGNLVFPTAQGDLKIGSGVNDKGQPIINISGPGIEAKEGVLEAAKGPGGIFTFNPSTGAITVYNGQDLPMDPRFATQGLGFVGDQNGFTRGIPAENPFVLPPAPTDDNTGKKTGLLLPSWPTEPILFALMLSLILLGVLGVRTTRR